MMRFAMLASMILTATQAAALTPLPSPCAFSGDLVEGREIDYSGQHSNGFVYYRATDHSNGRERLYLEHCATGKVLRLRSAADTVSIDNPRHPSNVQDVLFDALDSDERFTMSKLQTQLQAAGIAAKRYTSRSESCACQAYLPDAIGPKTPYKKVAK